jgi:membrane protein
MRRHRDVEDITCGPVATLNIARRAVSIFSARGARFLGAAVAFYALLSAAPLFVVVLHVVGAVFGKARAESALWDGLSHWLAPEGLESLRAVTERLDRAEDSAGIVGLPLVVYGSTRLFRALRRALNQLWGIDLEAVEAARSSAKKYGVRYGGALLLTLLVAVLLACLVVVKGSFAVLGALSRGAPPALLWALDAAASVGLTFVLFMVLFRVLPDTAVTWREAVVSATASTVLFALGSALVTLYVHHKRLGDLYAGASAIVVLVLWVYYSAQVFFLGACVGAALHEERRISASPS